VVAVFHQMTKGPGLKAILCVLWLAAVGAGFVTLWTYDSTAGTIGRTPKKWPEDATLKLEEKRDTLMLFAHPKCPCTRASLGELNRLLARCNGRLAAHVWFFRPGTASEEWVKTDLWQSAAGMPGVIAHEDLNGNEARKFGAETSGYAVLYDPQGRLLFRGGITGGRGHWGDNAGEDTVAALVTGGATDAKQTPVFGCSLLGNCGELAETAQQ